MRQLAPVCHGYLPLRSVVGSLDRFSFGNVLPKLRFIAARLLPMLQSTTDDLSQRSSITVLTQLKLTVAHVRSLWYKMEQMLHGCFKPSTQGKKEPIASTVDLLAYVQVLDTSHTGERYVRFFMRDWLCIKEHGLLEAMNTSAMCD